MHKDERTSSTHQRLRKAQRDESLPKRDRDITYKGTPISGEMPTDDEIRQAAQEYLQGTSPVTLQHNPPIRRQVPLRAAQVHLYAAVALAAVCVTILVLVLTS